jgi:dGTPase
MRARASLLLVAPNALKIRPPLGSGLLAALLEQGGPEGKPDVYDTVVLTKVRVQAARQKGDAPLPRHQQCQHGQGIPEFGPEQGRTMTIMTWEKLLSNKRLFGSAHPDDRSEFQKDWDRIIFSFAFRRLQRKTQVHPMPNNDYIHNRLTHSLEAASIGRSLGEGVGRSLKRRNRLPENVSVQDVGAIVQAACLAHDLGNPPFGHAGEFAIRDFYRKAGALLEGVEGETKRDLEMFEGNAQGFRLITNLESNPNDGGLRLTCATLGTFMKYPWPSSKAPKDKEKFGFYATETGLFREVADNLGLMQKSSDTWCRHPLAHLVEAADDICYAIIDLEDGVMLDILQVREFEDILLPLCGAAIEEEYKAHSSKPIRQKMGWLRSKAMGVFVGMVVKAFEENEEALLAGGIEAGLTTVCPESFVVAIKKAKALARDKVFKYPKKTEIEIGAYAAIDILLRAMSEAAKEATQCKGELSFRTKRIFDLMDEDAPTLGEPPAVCHRQVLDYVAGMTDDYVTYLAAQIGGHLMR